MSAVGDSLFKLLNNLPKSASSPSRFLSEQTGEIKKDEKREGEEKGKKLSEEQKKQAEKQQKERAEILENMQLLFEFSEKSMGRKGLEKLVIDPNYIDWVKLDDITGNQTFTLSEKLMTTAAGVAVAKNDLDVFQFLVKNGFNYGQVVHGWDKFSTPTIVAIATIFRSYTVLEWILSTLPDAQPDQPLKFNFFSSESQKDLNYTIPPLYLAFERNDVKAVELLLLGGADPAQVARAEGKLFGQPYKWDGKSTTAASYATAEEVALKVRARNSLKEAEKVCREALKLGQEHEKFEELIDKMYGHLGEAFRANKNFVFKYLAWILNDINSHQSPPKPVAAEEKEVAQTVLSLDEDEPQEQEKSKAAAVLSAPAEEKSPVSSFSDKEKYPFLYQFLKFVADRLTNKQFKMQKAVDEFEAIVLAPLLAYQPGPGSVLSAQDRIDFSAFTDVSKTIRQFREGAEAGFEAASASQKLQVVSPLPQASLSSPIHVGQAAAAQGSGVRVGGAADVAIPPSRVAAKIA